MCHTLVTFGVCAFPERMVEENCGTLQVDTVSLLQCKVRGRGGYFTLAQQACSRLEAYQIWLIQQVQGKEWPNLISLTTCYFLSLVLVSFWLTVFIVLNGPPVNFWSGCKLNIRNNVVLMLWRQVCTLRKQLWAEYITGEISHLRM